VPAAENPNDVRLVGPGRRQALFTGRTATGFSSVVKPYSADMTVHAKGSTTAGAGASVVIFYVSDVESPSVDGDWTEAGRSTLTLGTDATSDHFVIKGNYLNVRAKVDSISGTGASIDAGVVS